MKTTHGSKPKPQLQVPDVIKPIIKMLREENTAAALHAKLEAFRKQRNLVDGAITLIEAALDHNMMT